MYRKVSIAIIMVLSMILAIQSAAYIAPEAAKNKQDQLLREPLGVFDNQRNTVSNIDFFSSNYGILFFDIARSTGGGFWPRGSLNQYIFAGGLWFGSRKTLGDGPDDPNNRTKLVSITYNPNSGLGWYVPGRINEAGCGGPSSEDVFGVEEDDVNLYRVYFSTDFDLNTGEPIDEELGQQSWPIWDASTNPEDTIFRNRYFGYYISDPDERNLDTYPKGPAFISGEDIYSTFKDTDLSVYEQGAIQAESEGYPLELQIESMIYSWGFGDYKDFIFIKYEITNYSDDVLYDCWIAPVMDVDIARAPNTAFGAGNDRATFYDVDPSLNFAYQWTNGDRGEAGQGFGYLGFDFLESPAIIKTFDEDGNEIITDSTNYVRRDKPFYDVDEQIGLVTFRSWSIQQDPLQNTDRYDFISSGTRDLDQEAGDKRFMMATGEFNMRPCDTVRTVVGVVLASAALGGDADGSEEDVANLIEKDKFMQTVYDNNFEAPKPPEATRFTQDTRGLNNSVRVVWDNTAELSLDPKERGLDFMGYRLYRARDFGIDQYDQNTITEGDTTRGPLGWKEIGDWSIQTPFEKADVTLNIAEENPEKQYPQPDRMVVVDFVRNPDGTLDEDEEMNMWVARIPRGVEMWPDSILFDAFNEYRVAMISIDSSFFTRPWGEYYNEVVSRDPNISTPNNVAPIAYMQPNNPNVNIELYNDIMLGKLQLNTALQDYNPLLYKNEIIRVSPTWVNGRREFFEDGLIGDTVHVDTLDKNGNVVRDTLTVSIDTVYHYDTFRQVNNGDGTFGYTLEVESRRNLTGRDRPLGDLEHMRAMQDTVYAMIKRGVIADIQFGKRTVDNEGNVTITQFEDLDEVREGVIAPYMDRITNGRTFIDIGDDDESGIVQTNQRDLAANERLINNMPYYYKVIAYDEGDYLALTEVKENVANEGASNFTEVFPVSARAGEEPLFEIIEVDSNKIGGLYNFNFFSIDGDRVMQKFAGDTLEIEFQPYFFFSEPTLRFIDPATGQVDRTDPYSTSLYRSFITLRNLSKPDSEPLFQGYANYEAEICEPSFIGGLSEDAASYVLWSPSQELVDTVSNEIITFHMRNNEEVQVRTGRFSSGDFTSPGYCYNIYQSQDMLGTFGFSYDFEIQQWGGVYRPDSTTIQGKEEFGVDAVTPVKFITESAKGRDRILYTQLIGIDWYLLRNVYGGFNNGPGEYILEFTEGGTETLELYYDRNNPKPVTFEVPYLNVRVVNDIEYPITLEDGSTRMVRYPEEMEHLFIPDRVPADSAYQANAPYVGSFYHPDPRVLGRLNPDENKDFVIGVQEHSRATDEFIGKYNLSAYGWVNGRGENTPFRLPSQETKPRNNEFLDISDQFNVGTQGRYYLSAEDGQGNYIDFSHIINIGGIQFALDHANKGSAYLNRLWTPEPTDQYTQFGPQFDFQPGDRVVLKSQGGALGFPLPGAKVKAVVKSVNQEGDYSDDIMDEISIAPNPYYITHQGERSPYDGRLYFSKLPPRATIQIYTVSGDLVQTLEHDEQNGTDLAEGVAVWDLLSSGGLRVQSQAFVVHITTPDGGNTIKNFSVIQGGYRVIQE